ncbi:hypothetical protein DVH24_034652 [Malus domestica]|uniref:Uncharacterized protein n=1 Tax=Malus domestica TaxID=3750 RepID=A0A498J1A1_MALDO|nr:hypothetical protein DVH24_034652 [Malus domestica]
MGALVKIQGSCTRLSTGKTAEKLGFLIYRFDQGLALQERANQLSQPGGENFEASNDATWDILKFRATSEIKYLKRFQLTNVWWETRKIFAILQFKRGETKETLH